MLALGLCRNGCLATSARSTGLTWPSAQAGPQVAGTDGDHQGAEQAAEPGLTPAGHAPVMPDRPTPSLHLIVQVSTTRKAPVQRSLTVFANQPDKTALRLPYRA
jgi:hypothetical protein